MATNTSAMTEGIPEADNDNAARDDRIQKAVKFWKHPSVASISSKEKMNYLTVSKGLSEADIHQVWEALVEDDDDEGNTPAGEAPHAPAPLAAVPPLLLSQDDYYYDDVAPSPPHKCIALMAVGSMVGLTAAATVRWLNGGDFAILPPASSPSMYRNQTLIAAEKEGERRINREQDEEGDEVTEDNNGDEEDEDVQVNELSQKLEALTELVKIQSETQEQIFKKLTTQQTKQATDESMAILRGDYEDTKKLPSSVKLLMEVKELLERLQQQSPSSSGIAKEALDKLNTYVNQVVEDTTVSEPPQKGIDVNSNLHSSLLHAPESTTFSSSSRTNSKSSTPIHPSMILHQVIQRLALENDDRDILQSGCQVLYLYVLHLSSHPHVPRYRKIYTSNDSFQRVEKLKGGVDLLMAVGFVETDGYLEWQPEQESEALQMLKEALAALSIIKTAGGQSSSKEELSEQALATLPPIPAEASTRTTPTPLDNVHVEDDEILQLLGKNSGGEMTDIEPWQTPKTPNTANFLVSPPNTKRDPFLPTPCNFPESPPGEMLSVLNEASRGEDVMLDTSFDGVLDESSSAPSKLVFHSSSSLSPTKVLLGTSTTPNSSVSTAFRPVVPKMQQLSRGENCSDSDEIVNTSVTVQQPQSS